MFYNLIVLKNAGVIRSADKGLSDLEFQMGARVRAQASSKFPLECIAQDDMDLEDSMLSEEGWREMINEIKDSDDEPSAQHIRRPFSPEIIDRGPYSSYTRNMK